MPHRGSGRRMWRGHKGHAETESSFDTREKIQFVLAFLAAGTQGRYLDSCGIFRDISWHEKCCERKLFIPELLSCALVHPSLQFPVNLFT